ncbi:hypothetical protein EVAR_75599_1 [Eumeta japonica]|uniref:Uncharacterized protein n=1 Tax=Eumeta variegata TaxID=151549 RepID=A0A4C1U062_EUMVA|nr:hypothetical protein EVAR_75599_1 [Eumeta japonica]
MSSGIDSRYQKDSKLRTIPSSKCGTKYTIKIKTGIRSGSGMRIESGAEIESGISIGISGTATGVRSDPNSHREQNWDPTRRLSGPRLRSYSVDICNEGILYIHRQSGGGMLISI